jgi:hypothetical protein
MLTDGLEYDFCDPQLLLFDPQLCSSLGATVPDIGFLQVSLCCAVCVLCTCTWTPTLTILTA